jgi:hypothetical protein
MDLDAARISAVLSLVRRYLRIRGPVFDHPGCRSSVASLLPRAPRFGTLEIGMCRTARESRGRLSRMRRQALRRGPSRCARRSVAGGESDQPAGHRRSLDSVHRRNDIDAEARVHVQCGTASGERRKRDSDR